MFEGMDELEILLYIEKRFGILTKSIPGDWSLSKVESINGELNDLLTRIKKDLSLKGALPKVKSWVAENKVHFLFFDKQTGKRVFLGEWLAGKELKYEH